MFLVSPQVLPNPEREMKMAYSCKKVFRRHCLIYVCVTAFVWIFSRVYEYFGHGVISKAMMTAFWYPCLMGMIPTLILALIKPLKNIAYAGILRVGVNLLYCGIATLTVGSLLSGVVEIYGTTYHLLKYYYYAGAVLSALGVILCIVSFAKGQGENERRK